MTAPMPATRCTCETWRRISIATRGPVHWTCPEHGDQRHGQPLPRRVAPTVAGPELAGHVAEHDVTYHHVVVTHDGANYRCPHHHLSPEAAGDCLARVRRTFRNTGHLPPDLRPTSRKANPQ